MPELSLEKEVYKKCRRSNRMGQTIHSNCDW